MRSNFGSGYVLSGTHPNIIAYENTLCKTAKVLVNTLPATSKDLEEISTVVTCNRSVVRPFLPEFWEAEELGIRAPKSCKRCQGCKDCSFRQPIGICYVFLHRKMAKSQKKYNFSNFLTPNYCVLGFPCFEICFKFF